jgi:lysophospholipase L1-like esterase
MSISPIVAAGALLFVQVAGAAEAPKLQTLSVAESEKLAAARTAALRDPSVKDVNDAYKKARKAYQLDRAKYPKDRDRAVAIEYRKATKALDEAVARVMVATDPAIEPLLKKLPRKRNEGETAADSDGLANPAIAPITDVPGLPRVLLIGDSISIGYTLDVRALLKGKANVHRIPVNGGATEVGLANLKEWLGAGQWDVIHFNFGLHDAKFASETEQRASREQYVENLRLLVTQMRKTGAKLIFATTTPVPKDGVLTPTRRFDSIEARNDLAVKLMRESDVAIDDLYAVAKPVMTTVGRSNDVHFAPEGYKLLAKAVAESIEKELPKGR